MSEIAITDTVTFTDSTTVNTVTTQSDTITFTDNITIRTTVTQSDTVTFTDKAVLTTVKTYADILRFYETVTIERIRADRIVESRVITYPERVIPMNLDLLFDALALTVREISVKMGEDVRDIGMVFLAGTYGVESIKMTKDIELMLRRTLDYMIKAMKR